MGHGQQLNLKWIWIDERMDEWHGTSLIPCQHWFLYWLGANADPDLCSHMEPHWVKNQIDLTIVNCYLHQSLYTKNFPHLMAISTIISIVAISTGTHHFLSISSPPLEISLTSPLPSLQLLHQVAEWMTPENISVRLHLNNKIFHEAG